MKQENDTFEIIDNNILADKKLSVGGTTNNDKIIIYDEGVEYEDPYLNRWFGGGAQIIIG